MEGQMIGGAPCHVQFAEEGSMRVPEEPYLAPTPSPTAAPRYPAHSHAAPPPAAAPAVLSGSGSTAGYTYDDIPPASSNDPSYDDPVNYYNTDAPASPVATTPSAGQPGPRPAARARPPAAPGQD